MSDLLFEYKVRARHRLGWKEFTFYATTDIEEFLNRNSINYVRNMTDTIENRQLKEIERLNNIINELEKDFERKIQSCTIEAETTTNDFYCRLHIATLKKWLNKIQELKGEDKE